MKKKPSSIARFFQTKRTVTHWCELLPEGRVQCRIRGLAVNDARMRTLTDEYGDILWYICHNVAGASGAIPADGNRLGYDYSFVLVRDDDDLPGTCRCEKVTRLRVLLPVCPFAKEVGNGKTS